MVASPEKWIRFRRDAPERYEQMAMAHYSVFYLLGRAAKRFSEERAAFEYPEDVLFLLDSVGDNCKRFLETMDQIGEDCGRTVFGSAGAQFTKRFAPFKEISDYRNTLLHDTVLGRGIGTGKVYLPKWSIDRKASPLEMARRSWRHAEHLGTEDLVSTRDLLERLIEEVCATLESLWKQAIAAVSNPSFERKMVQVTGLVAYFPLKVQPLPLASLPSASGAFITAGSNTNFVVVEPAKPGATEGNVSSGGIVWGSNMNS